MGAFFCPEGETQRRMSRMAYRNRSRLLICPPPQTNHRRPKGPQLLRCSPFGAPCGRDAHRSANIRLRDTLRTFRPFPAIIPLRGRLRPSVRRCKTILSTLNTPLSTLHSQHSTLHSQLSFIPPFCQLITLQNRRIAHPKSTTFVIFACHKSGKFGTSRHIRQK